ncbi:hypothetical protein IIA95_02300 [Patescibacteria group bacterium]|nr:hypothetical protein [Patescibacteria group bacterium]
MKRALRKIYRDVVKVFENFFSEIGDKQLEILNDLREYKQELATILHEEYTRLRKKVHAYIQPIPRKIIIFQKYANKQIQIFYKKSYRLMRSWSIVFQRRFNSYKKFLINRYADKIIIFYKQLKSRVVEYIRFVSQNIFEYISKYDTSLNIKQRHLTLLKKLTAVVLNITVVAMSLAPAIYFIATPNIALADTAVIRPDGDFSVNWTSTPSGTNFTTIDEVVTQPTAGDDTDFIRSATNNQVDEFDMGTISNVDTATQVQVWAYAKADTNDDLGINIVIDGTPQTRQDIGLTTGFTWVSATFSSLSLTQTQVDGLRVQLVEAKAGPLDAVEVATMYADVTFTSSAVPITVSGTLYSDEGISQIDGGGVTVQLRVATATPGIFSTTTDSGSGVWKIENIEGMAVGNAISVWIDGDVNTRAFTVTKASTTNGNITNLDLYQNRLIVKHEATSGTSTTNADLAFFDNDNDSDIQFTAVDGGALTIFKDQELHVWDGDTFAPGGSITIHGNASSTTDGSLHIDNNATLTAGGAISVAGNWDGDTGSTFTSGSNAVTFNASTTAKTITVPATNADFFSIDFNDAAGAWTFNSSATTTDNFTITAGAVTGPSSGVLVVGDNYSNSGTFTANSSTVKFNAGDAGNTIDPGSSSFFDLLFDGAGDWTFGANPGTTTNDFIITSGAVTAPSGTLYIGRDFTNNGTFTHNSGTLIFNGTIAQALGGTMSNTSGFNNVEFSGAGTKTFNANASTSAFTIDSGSGTTTAPSGLLTIAGNYSNSGVYEHNNGTVFFASTSNQTLGGTMTGSSTFNHIEFLDSGTKTFNANASTTDFTIQSGSGIVTAPSGLLSISGNYTNNGTFTHNSGTTTLNGVSPQTLSGTMTSPSAFNNLEIINSSGTDAQTDPSIIFSSAVSASSTFTAITADTKLRFLASATSTLTNIDLNGQAVGTRVTLRSSTAGTQWNLAVPGTRSVLNTDIKDSNACSGDPNIDATNDSNSDGGNNSCWNLPTITISGTLYSNEGTTQITTGKTINLSVNGGASQSTTTDSGAGTWSIDLTANPAIGNPIAVWVDADSATRAFVLTKASTTGENITGLDLYQNRLIVKHEGTSGTSTTIADLALFDSDDDADIQFTANGGALSVFKDQELHIWNGDTFVPGGAITIHGNASSTTDGSLHIDDNATLTAGGAISVAGNWDADTGSTFTEGGNAVTFNATTTGKTIAGTLTGSNAFGNVTFNGSGGAWTFSNNASTSAFAITSGTVTAPSSLLSISGNYTNNGTFTHNSGTTTLNGASPQTFSGTLDGTSEFNNLEITNSSGTDAQTDPSIIFSSAVSASSTLTAITPNSKLRFLANATSTLTNINLNGQALGTKVSLRSSVAGTPWGLESSGTRSVLNTNVADSNACSGNPNIDATDSSNTDSGGNTCWDFPAEPEPEPEPEAVSAGEGGILFQPPKPEVLVPLEEAEKIEQIREQLEEIKAEVERIQKVLRELAPPLPIAPIVLPPVVPSTPPAPEIPEPAAPPAPIEILERPILKSATEIFTQLTENVRQIVDVIGQNAQQTVEAIGQTIGQAIDIGQQVAKKMFRTVAYAVKTTLKFTRSFITRIPQFVSDILPEREVSPTIPEETFVLRRGELELVARKDEPIQTIAGFRFRAEIKPSKPALQITDTFSYSDPDNDGVWTAEVEMPRILGRFTLNATIAYADGESKEIKTAILIDPEGYVYEDTSRGELRVANAKVTLWQKEGKLSIVWPAKLYGQENPQITDRTGQYSFLAPPGEYYLEITADNYKPFITESFILTEIAPAHQNIELQYLGETL